MNSNLRANCHHLYVDALWFGVLSGSAMAFLAIYAARCGASSIQISLLTAGPALVNLFFSLPVGRWLEQKSLAPVTFWSAIAHRLGYVLLLPLPWLFTTYQETWMLVLITILMSLPGVALAIGFNALFADVVPPEMRGVVVGKRNALLAIGVVLTSLLCGQLLDRIVFPLNYQIVFGIGVLGALFSTYHVGRLRSQLVPPPRIGQPLQDFARPGFLHFADGLRISAGLRYLTRLKESNLLRMDLLRGPFGPFMGAYFLFYLSQYLPVAFFALWYVNGLGLSDWEIGTGSAMFYGSSLLASMLMGKVSQRLGHRHLLVGSTLFFCTYPLLLSLAWDVTLYWVACVITGFNFAWLSGSLLNRLMERTPVDDRPAHMALHNLTLNLGILCGALVGSLVAETFELRIALLIAAGLRLLAGVLMIFWA